MKLLGWLQPVLGLCALVLFARQKYLHALALIERGGARAGYIQKLYGTLLSKARLHTELARFEKDHPVVLSPRRRLEAVLAVDDSEPTMAAMAQLALRTPAGSRARNRFAVLAARADAALALSVLTPGDSDQGLYMALLARAGRVEEARARMVDALAGGEVPADYLLLASNLGLQQGDATAPIDWLNRYLARHAQPTLALKDPSRPLSAWNVRARDPVVPVTGPRVSIVMTTFNSADYIAHAIDSVLGQSYQSWELIVVDDASRDRTAERVSAYAAADPRIRLVSLPCNVGTYVAKNIGLRYATGVYATCHDSDDWALPTRLQHQVERLERSGAVAVYARWLRISEEGAFYNLNPYPLLNAGIPTLLFRREPVLERIGYYDTVRADADNEFLLRVRIAFGHKAAPRFNRPLMIAAHRAGSLTTDRATGAHEPRRMAYRQQFARWHIESLKCGRTPYLPFPHHPRQFAVADGWAVADAAVARAVAESHLVPSAAAARPGEE